VQCSADLDNILSSWYKSVDGLLFTQYWFDDIMHKTR